MKKGIYLQKFPAALAIYLRNPIRGQAYTFKKFPAARAIYLRNPIREKAYTLKKFPAARPKYLNTEPLYLVAVLKAWTLS